MHERTRQNIVKKVRELRLQRHWTQARLARLLDLSQNRLSEIETGQGSFTAEQLLTILTNFNVPLDYFVDNKATEEDQLQNALARLGAGHLQENPNVLATERIKGVIEAVSETLATGKSPRLITALAPVIVHNANPGILNQIRYKLIELGFIHPYGWVLENTLNAIRSELHENPNRIPKDLRVTYKRAERVIDNLLRFSRFIPSWFASARIGDKILKSFWQFGDESIGQETFLDVKKTSSKISKKWGIVTRIQPEDFVDALRHGFNY